jgi:catechol 2,3-dioxygenase-like lactoylglutathione lyase family enzyme
MPGDTRRNRGLGATVNRADEFWVAQRSESQKQHPLKARGGREMAGWEKKIGAINLIVGDLERSKEFYRSVFELPIQHEDEDAARFRFGDTFVFLQHGAAHQDGPSSDGLSLAKKGVGQFVMFVEDVDAVRDELHQSDVAIISGPSDRDWGMRTLTLADPAGYTWEITQELPSAPSSS